jgi:hypothetical protein
VKLRRVAWAAAVAVAVVLIGGVAYASIPGPDGTIHGCYKTSNPAQGSVIVVDSSASCPNGYTTLSWNQTGPQGPAGVSGYEVIVEQQTIPANTTDTILGIQAVCPSGKNVSGGGASAISFAQSDTWWLTEYSRPAINAGSYAIWQAQFRRQGPAPATNGSLIAYAICVTEG